MAYPIGTHVKIKEHHHSIDNDAWYGTIENYDHDTTLYEVKIDQDEIKWNRLVFENEFVIVSPDELLLLEVMKS